jgi:hypothetical protein
MQMARHLSGLRNARGFVPQEQPTQAQLLHHLPIQPARGMGIVIAGNPDEVRRARQRFQQGAFRRSQAGRGIAIVKESPSAITRAGLWRAMAWVIRRKVSALS